MSELAEGWVYRLFSRTSLREMGVDVGRLGSRARIKIRMVRYGFYSLPTLDMGFSLTSQTASSTSRSSTNSGVPSCLEGDVLIARMPDPLGCACLAPRLRQRCITVVNVAIVALASESVRPAWLMHFLNAPEVRQEIEVQSSGTTRRRISREQSGSTTASSRPPHEQKRIADKLDAVLTRVDACRERLDRVPAILKRFRQSVLSAATSGKLTEEWREDNQVTETAIGLIKWIAEERKRTWFSSASLVIR